MGMKFGTGLSFVSSEKMGRGEAGLGSPQHGPTRTLVSSPGGLALSHSQV